MPKLAANLGMMFQEVGFLDRFAAAAAAGFRGVEFLFPYEFPPFEIAARLQRNRLTQALFNLPPGDWSNGERGMAALPGREEEFMAGLERALDYALATGCTRLHAMAGNYPIADTLSWDLFLGVGLALERVGHRGVSSSHFNGHEKCLRSKSRLLGTPVRASSLPSNSSEIQPR